EPSRAPPGARHARPRRRVRAAFGASEPPPSTARPVPSGFNGRATADHPPGFYGPPEGLLAVNTLLPADRPAAIDFAPLHARVEPDRFSGPHALRAPPFLPPLAPLPLAPPRGFSPPRARQRPAPPPPRAR